MTFLLSVFSGCSRTSDNKSGQIKTGIIGALAEEVTLLKEKMSDTKTTTVAGMEFCEGNLDGKDVIVVQNKIDIVSKEGKTITSIPLNEITVCSQINGESSISP